MFPTKRVGHSALGLERLCMVLFSIPDIRLFWSEDPRFASQFKAGEITTFKPYSKYPPVIRDMSFWIPDVVQGGDGSTAGLREWHENDFCEIVRDIAGDMVEKCNDGELCNAVYTASELIGTDCRIDEFTHPKSKRRSKTYRLNYRSMDRSVPAS